MHQESNIVDILMKASGKNLSQLAVALTDFQGKSLTRQQLQYWRKGNGMRLSTYKVLENYLASLRKKRGKANVR